MARDLLGDDRPEPKLEYLGIPSRRKQQIEEILTVRPDGLIKRKTKSEPEVRDDSDDA